MGPKVPATPFFGVFRCTYGQIV